MNKGHVLKELSSYLDNQLSPKQRLEVEEHLKSCTSCSQELSRLKLLSEKLKTWQVPSLGPEFDSTLKNKIVLGELERSEVKMKKRTLINLIPSGVIAAILVVAFMFMQTYVRRGLQGRLRSASDNLGDNYAMRVNGPMKSMESQGIGGEKDYDVYIVGQQLSREESSMPMAKVTPLPSLETPSTEGTVIVVQPIIPATGEGEKVIRTADIRLEVDDGNETYKKASSICQELGGYLAASNFYKDNEGRQSGSITMRIPKDKFLTALDKLSSLGKVENMSSNSKDVSQEYANLKTQLDTTLIVYNKVLEAMQKRQVTVPEAIRLESELTPIRQRIEDLKNKVEYLNNSVSFTTVNLNFSEPIISGKVLKESRRFIRESILTAKINAVKFFAGTIKAIPTLIGIVVWFVLALGVILLVKYCLGRIFKRG